MKKRFWLILFLILLSVVFCSCKKSEDTGYTVTFDFGNGETFTVKTAGNERVEPPTLPVREDFEFLGWFLDKDVWSEAYDADYFTERGMSASLTVYARWKEKTYCYVTFETNGGSAVAIKRLNPSEKLDEPATQRENHVFLGWCEDYTLTSLYDFEKPVTSDITLYAKWLNPHSPATFIISFDENGCTAVENRQLIAGEKVIFPESSKKGYVLLGWYLDEALTVPYSFDNMVASNFTLYAKWEKSEVRITVYFVTYFGEGLPDETVDYGGKLSAKTPVREGYDFSGWYTDTALTQIFSYETKLFADTVLYAKWTPKQIEKVYYTVTFNSNGGSVVSPTQCEAGTAYPYYKPSKEDYVFEGWFLDEELSKACDHTAPVTKDVTLYAKWKQKVVFNEENYTFKLSADGNFYTVTAYTGKETAVVVPSTYRGLPVKGIEDGAYRQKSVVTVVLSDVLESIGASAFYGCTELISLTVKANVKSVGLSAFEKCVKLEELLIKGDTVFGEKSFSDCSKLTRVKAETGLTPAANMFKGCVSLAEVDLGENCLNVGRNAFYECRALKTLSLPASCLSIGASAFAYCSSFSGLTLSEGFKELGSSCLIQTAVEELILPESAVKISSNVFENSRLKSLYIGKGVTDVSLLSFVGASFLSEISISSENPAYSVRDGSLCDKSGELLVTYSHGSSALEYTIPNSVKIIADYAFCGAVNLKKLVITDGVATAPGSAFSTLSCISEFEVEEGNSAFKELDGHLYSKDGKSLIRYAPSSVAESFVIPEGVERIEPLAFAFAVNLTSVVLPSTLVALTERAFACASVLNEVVFHENTRSVGAYCFYECSSLSEIDLKNVETIGQNAFSRTALTEIVLSEKAVTVASSAFAYCESLEKIEILGAAEISANTFTNCTSLTEVILGESVGVIKSSAFSGCSALVKVTLNSLTLVEIMNNAFSSSPTVYVPASLLAEYTAEYENINFLAH